MTKKKLKDFTPNDNIVNKFEEILRHNNVSDKENAFNRLVALFICKLVDEITKSDDDIVEFQYKQGTDTYETLQDRLQRLHTEGMNEFMHEKIFYVPEEYPEQLFATYTGQQRQKAIDDLKATIRILKFYSNNDFSFKDVHNEELFYQNGKILVEVVKLFQEYRIVYPSKHQFLGDLFEQLLNKGFKQNEGQFFTPIPITRFIWDSLPINKMIRSGQGTFYPKVIDYACGAGHFLTEAVEAINFFAGNSGNNSWVREHIFGIEKDYRLARVSKISLFMNGAGEGNIIFGDGLENTPEKQIENNSFDILVANPPYSVSAFKQHLKLKNNSFELLEKITNSGSEIEVLFVERIAQLLKAKGLAAVILPSSILSNDNASYVGAREKILRNFYIRAIVQFGSKTFGETGTNTVVLFLEKYNEPPKKTDLITDSINAIFSGKALKDWIDKEIYEKYLVQIELTDNDYQPFISESASLKDLSKIEYFRMYVKEFFDMTMIKNLIDSKAFNQKDETEKETELKQRFYQFAKMTEREKIFYFALTYTQKTVIITAPSENAKQKEFLGYDWSNRKGNEGIQIIKRGGKMYNDTDRTAKGTLASIIRSSFDGTFEEPNEENKAYTVFANTCDMLDYTRVNFNKYLKLSVSNQKSKIFQNKYPLQKLGEIAKYVQDRKKISDINLDLYISTDNMIKNRGGIERYLGVPNVESVISYQIGDILVSNIRPYLKKIWFSDAESGCSSDVLVFRVMDNTMILSKYLYYVMSLDDFFDYIMSNPKGTKMPRGNKEFILQFFVPVPPIDVQQQLIDECEKIDEEYNNTRMSIDTYKQKIEDIFAELEITNGIYRLSLSDTEKFSVSIGKRVLNNELVSGGKIPVFSANVKEPFGYTDKLLFEDFSKDSVLWGIDGDWMVNYYEKNQPFYPTDHCGVLRVLTDNVNPRYMAKILEKEGKKMNFSRSYRASVERIKGITFTVPDVAVQNEKMVEVIGLEEKIKTAKEKLVELDAKRSETVKKYL